MFVITDSCIACGACCDACPVGAIVMDDGLGRYVITEDACLDCGACADTCPMGCIVEA